MTRRAPEQSLHRIVAEYLAMALTEATLATTFPLGGGGYNHGARNKQLGTVPGWPDWQLVSNGRFIGIELKTKSRGLNAAQQACHKRIIAAGGFVCICRSVEEVEQTLRGLKVPLRASLARDMEGRALGAVWVGVA